MTRPVAAIVDPYTSGSALAPELARRGYECVRVQSRAVVPEVFRSSLRPDDFSSSVQHEGDVARTSVRLRELGVAFVIAGCEPGVELADALSEALDLPSNGAAARSARRDKGLMADAFRDAGLRVPQQHRASQLEPLIEWARRDGRWPLVAKPSNSSSSDGVQLCRSERDLEAAFGAILGQENVLGLVNHEVVVQEYLSGPEYVVDTVSCGGRHRLVAIWRYHKPAPTASFIGYDAMELMPARGDVQQRLFDEARRGLEALEIRLGPAHSELIWSDAGPVLLEIGARLHGGENPGLAGRCGALSQIEETVRAYTDPAAFTSAADPEYELTRHCRIAFLMPPSPERPGAWPRASEIEALESFHQMDLADEDEVGEPVPRVIGWVALVHPRPEIVDRDLARLREPWPGVGPEPS
jgi:biotin carboxylase